MDAIDEVRARLASAESRLVNAEAIGNAAYNLAVQNSNRIQSMETNLSMVGNELQMLQINISMLSSQGTIARLDLLKLVNQVAVVAATLGSAIWALKRGDSAESDRVLNEAIQSQQLLGAMINEFSGKAK